MFRVKRIATESQVALRQSIESKAERMEGQKEKSVEREQGGQVRKDVSPCATQPGRSLLFE